MPEDRILESFLRRQRDEGLRLARESDILDLQPHDDRRYLAKFHARSFVWRGGQAALVEEDFVAGVAFGADHLRRSDPARTAFWVWPPDIFNPHVRPPAVCLGRFSAGIGLAELLYQLWEVISWQRTALHDALNPEASRWGRANHGALPADARPLLKPRLRLKLRVEERSSS